MSDQFFISLSTVPDIDALRSIHQFTDLSDEGVLSAALHLHHQQHGHTVLPLYQQQIISMAVIKQTESGEVSLHCLQNDQGCDAALLKQLDALVNKKSRLVSWDMGNVDQPLINYRLLKHSFVSENLVSAQKDSLSNQLGHIEGAAGADLAGLSMSIGLPSIAVLSQPARIECYLNKQLTAMHDVNQTLALSTYLLYLRLRLINTEISMDDYVQHESALRTLLKGASSTALRDYESAWQAA